MSRADFAVRPARDRRRIGMGSAALATDRPVPRHVVEQEGARTPAEAVCNRLHLWHMVSAF